ncbi:MOSC domain-containing protein [Thiomicrorhabdus sp.]|uniref:MOSC domain-containing protein n=1 Tax=Thiomicrorhabdus sp. TaxID=2039724 RepID=UPI00356A6B77
MKLVSVNIGKIQRHQWKDGDATESGLYKSPVHGLVHIGLMGLDGDEQADLKNHGGFDKAVFILPAENYDLFRIHEPYGFLGENLTVSEIDETQICLGDHLQVGSVLLEVSQPRSPCWKLAEHVKSVPAWKAAGNFLNDYSESGRVGFYCRVLQEGILQKGNPVIWLPREVELSHGYSRITIKDLFLAKQHHKTEKDWQLLRAAEDHPALSLAWKKSIHNLLADHAKHSL